MNDVTQVSKAPLMEAVDVFKTYRKETDPLKVLTGTSFSIPPGKVLGIVGASGVGKSTLLHVIGGLDHPDSGNVYFRGEDIFAQKSGYLETYRNNHIGFVFQQFNLLHDFSALENVMFPPLIKKIDKKLAQEKAEEYLCQMGLKDRMHHRPGELSGGECQRVALARALINEPELLLADEPTGNLDTNTADGLVDLIRKLNEELGQTFVIVTHSQRVAKKLDEVYQLFQGKVQPLENEVVL